MTKQQKIYSNFVRRNQFNTVIGKRSTFKQKHTTLEKVYLEPINLNYLKNKDNFAQCVFSSVDENLKMPQS